MSTDSTGKFPPCTIHLVPGKLAPRSDSKGAADLVAAVITEQGTKNNLPIVDLIVHIAVEGEDGIQLAVTTSGRIICMIADAIDGVNLRNHGKTDP